MDHKRIVLGDGKDGTLAYPEWKALTRAACGAKDCDDALENTGTTGEKVAMNILVKSAGRYWSVVDGSPSAKEAWESIE